MRPPTGGCGTNRDLIPNTFALKTIFGWVTDKELNRYTRDFDREAEAVGMLIRLNERRQTGVWRKAPIPPGTLSLANREACQLDPPQLTAVSKWWRKEVDRL